MIRQGDVLLIPRSAPIPTTATLVPRDKGRVVLAYGEVTGHAHALTDADINLLILDGKRFLSAPKGGTLRHEEHSTLTVPATLNGYDVIRQSEWQGTPIQVAD